MRAQHKKIKPCAAAGFTLVELVVVMAMLMILTTGLAALSKPALDTARVTIGLSDDRMVATAIVEQLVSELSCAVADSVEVTDGGGGLSFSSSQYGEVSVYNGTDDGRVHVVQQLSDGTGNEIGLEEGAYAGCKAEIAFELSGSVVRISLYMKDDWGNNAYFMERNVQLLNISDE